MHNAPQNMVRSNREARRASEDAVELSAGGAEAHTPQADTHTAEPGAPVPKADAAVIPDLLTYPSREMSGLRGRRVGERTGGQGRPSLSVDADGWRSAG